MAYTGWPAGSRLTSARMDAISGIWTPYNVVWSSTSGAAPSLGAGGFLEGEYALVGGMCTVRVTLVGGASTTWGGGQFAFSLPFSVATLGNGAASYDGSALGLDSGAAYYAGVSRIWSAGTVIMPIGPTTATGSTPGEWNATRPFTWGNGDSLSVQGTYKPA